MEFLVEYGMFLAKAITIIASFGAVLVMIVSASHRKVSVDDKGELTITALNDDYEKTKNKLTLATLDDAEKKVEQKKIKAQTKLAANKNNRIKKRVFVVNFNGDLAATEVDNLLNYSDCIRNSAQSKKSYSSFHNGHKICWFYAMKQAVKICRPLQNLMRCMILKPHVTQLASNY